MYNFPIGAMVDSFDKDFKTSVKLAADIGAKGIQMYCTYGEHAPENMTKEKTKEILDIVKSSGLGFFGNMRRSRHGIRRCRKKQNQH